MNDRLPRNFHRTFVPERRYISEMLRFAASGAEGTYQEISEVTGIPMGESTGKVPAIFDYCRGMGLITETSKTRDTIRKPRLTALGRLVLAEDPFLKEPITQWLAHMNLCRRNGGAEIWFYTFFSGAQVLGNEFSRDELQKYLERSFKTNASKIIGPIVSMYQESASFEICGALSTKGNTMVRQKAPLSETFTSAYCAWLLQLLENSFGGKDQVSLVELDRQTGWRTIPGWTAQESQKVLQMMERKGAIAVDRHMDPWLLSGLQNANSFLRNMYEDII